MHLSGTLNGAYWNENHLTEYSRYRLDLHYVLDNLPLSRNDCQMCQNVSVRYRNNSIDVNNTEEI